MDYYQYYGNVPFVLQVTCLAFRSSNVMQTTICVLRLIIVLMVNSSVCIEKINKPKWFNDNDGFGQITNTA